MIVPLGLTGTAADKSGWVSASFEKVDNGGKSIHSPLGEYESEAEDEYSANDVVRVSIVLKGKSTLEKGFSTEGIAQNKAARNYRAGVKAQQDKLANNISRLALGGEKLDVVWNLTLAANVISANVKYGQIKNIKSVPGVKDVVIETRYLPAEVEEAADPQMSTATEMTGANYIYSEYNGAGESVAIIDTGLDVEHELYDPDAFEYAILEDQSYLDDPLDLITAQDVADVFDQLNVKAFADVTADDLYVNSKIPFAFNYVDGDLDVSHANDTEGEHGSHVAGIAAANRYVKVGSQFKESLEAVYTMGEAPDAQLLVMKVFGRNGGAYDSDYFAAVEDAIVLGAASANLSLGSAVAGTSFNSTYQDLLDSLSETDVNVIMSAGNNGSWADQTLFGYLYGEDKNLFTGGSPGSYVNSLSVASVDNYGQTGASFKFFGKSVFYTEKEYSNLPMTTLRGDYEFVAIEGVGTESEFELLDDMLDGKIAICSRGETSFFQKAEAAVKYGAAATVIYNNTAGTISMDLSDYSYTNPCVSITQADGQFILENAEEHVIYPEYDSETGALIKDGITYYTGKVTMPDGIEVNRPDGLEYLTMSDFSSYGLPGSLILKPEITAPGGNIYSANGYHLDDDGKPAGGHDKYENMSGTSMAAPQIAGLSAVFHQYAKEEKLVE
ncbi:MAG: S8 family serine peptidase, partial [Clostridia bacterium]|nr:S8 family serine peptidase [Clostridia bacterium]